MYKNIEAYDIRKHFNQNNTKGCCKQEFEVKTDKGKFILQRITEWGKWKKEKMKLEIKVLNHLKRGFEYEVPVPIKNKEGKYITMLEREPYWMYTKINGQTILSYTLHEFSRKRRH